MVSAHATLSIMALAAFLLALRISGNASKDLVKENVNQPCLRKPEVPEEARVSLFPDSCEQVKGTKTGFDAVYREGVWGPKLPGAESFYGNAAYPPPIRNAASGGGSNLGAMTVTSMRILRDLIKKHNITSMIDLPSGDTNWIFDSFETDHLETYVGLDIVEPLIKLNKKKFEHHTNKHFRHWDGAACPLPKISRGGSKPQPVQLIHSRDVIQHLPLDMGVKFLCNVLIHGADFFVTTTHPGTRRNKDVEMGGYYLNNLFISPFDLKREGVTCERTQPTEYDDTCVFDLSQGWVKEWISSKNCPLPL